MKVRLFFIVSLALLATGCFSHMEVNYFEAGQTVDEARQAMRQGGYDYALVMTGAAQQHTIYGWTDSLVFDTRCIDSFADLTVKDTIDTNSFGLFRMVCKDGKSWSVWMESVPKWILNMKIDSVVANSDGVEFRVRLHNLPMARATLVTDRPELCSTTFFDQPWVMGLMFHAIVDKLMGSEEDFDEIDASQGEEATNVDDAVDDEQPWTAHLPSSLDPDSIAAHNAAIEFLANEAKRKGWEFNYESFDDSPYRGLLIFRDGKKNRHCYDDVEHFMSVFKQHTGSLRCVRVEHSKRHRQCSFRCY